MTLAKVVAIAMIAGLLAALVGWPAQAVMVERPALPHTSGPLCCSDGVCVEWSGSPCFGALGWAEYSPEVDSDTGLTVAEVTP